MARRPLKERAISAGVVIPAAIIIVALAFLQYSWSNQVSEATSLRLADSLQMSMINWHLDFFRDFSQICVALGIDPDGEAPSDVQQIAKSFSEWKTSAAYPDLVSDLYVVEANSGTNSPVLHFNGGTRVFRSEAAPGELDALLGKLKAMHP